MILVLSTLMVHTRCSSSITRLIGGSYRILGWFRCKMMVCWVQYS